MSPSIDIIIPTYQEADNIKALVERIANVRAEQHYNLNLFFVDDNSQDGTEKIVEELALDWVNLIVRKDERGLSSAVLKGIDTGTSDYIVVMDADLSHPPEAIPSMLKKLEEGADFVVGSRYIEGGSTDDNWGFYRWLNSQIATLLARPFTNISDPMSGFFSLKREKYNQAIDLNPVGYKIGLELIVKCNCKRVVEVPIHFSDRIHGESKLNFKEQLKYIQHIRRLFVHKYGSSSEIVQFLAVGMSGVVVNLSTLTFLVSLGMERNLSVAAAIAVSICTNFLLNRNFTFGHSRNGKIHRQFVTYASTVSIGAVVNFIVAYILLAMFPDMRVQFASLAGILAATTLDFMAMKFIVFKKKPY